eukprot:983331-Amphidinium_carterae.1
MAAYVYSDGMSGCKMLCVGHEVVHSCILAISFLVTSRSMGGSYDPSVVPHVTPKWACGVHQCRQSSI